MWVQLRAGLHDHGTFGSASLQGDVVRFLSDGCWEPIRKLQRVVRSFSSGFLPSWDPALSTSPEWAPDAPSEGSGEDSLWVLYCTVTLRHLLWCSHIQLWVASSTASLLAISGTHLNIEEPELVQEMKYQGLPRLAPCPVLSSFQAGRLPKRWSLFRVPVGGGGQIPSTLWSPLPFCPQARALLFLSLSSFHTCSQLEKCRLPLSVFSFVLTQTSRPKTESLSGNLWGPGVKRVRKLQKLCLPGKMVNVLKRQNERGLENLFLGQ